MVDRVGALVAMRSLRAKTGAESTSGDGAGQIPVRNPVIRSVTRSSGSRHPRQDLEDLLPAGLALLLDGRDPLVDPGDGVLRRADRTRGADRARSGDAGGTLVRAWARGRRRRRRQVRAGRRRDGGVGAGRAPRSRRDGRRRGRVDLGRWRLGRGGSGGPVGRRRRGRGPGRRSSTAAAAGWGGGGAAACRPGDLASSSFSSCSSRDRSCSRSSSSRITSICSRCIDAEHLDQHAHGLLELVEHLLLHHAELVDQRHEHRIGLTRGGAGRRRADAGVGGGTSSTPAAEATTGYGGVGIGISGPAKAGNAGTARRRPAGGRGRRAAAARASRRTSRGSGRGHGPGLAAADLHAIPADPQHVAVGQGAEADRVGVDADARGPPAGRRPRAPSGCGAGWRGTPRRWGRSAGTCTPGPTRSATSPGSSARPSPATGR